MAEEGIDPSVGSLGDSSDNALAKSVIDVFKAEVISFLGPAKTMTQIEWKTLKWVASYNAKRLHGAIGYMAPNQARISSMQTRTLTRKPPDF